MNHYLFNMKSFLQHLSKIVIQYNFIMKIKIILIKANLIVINIIKSYIYPLVLKFMLIIIL